MDRKRALIKDAAATAAGMAPPPVSTVSSVNCAELEKTTAEQARGAISPHP
jgi:hypothetical protein